MNRAGVRRARGFGLVLTLIVVAVGIAVVWRVGADDEDARSTVRESVADYADQGPLRRDAFDPNALFVEVLVATEDIPACTNIDGWEDAMELIELAASDIPDGALIDTGVVSRRVIAHDVEAGDVIRAQLFTKASNCPKPSD